MASEVYTLKIEGMAGEQYRLNTFHFLGAGVDTNDTHHASVDLITMWNTHLSVAWLNCFPSIYSIYRKTAKRTRLKPSAHYSVVSVIGALPGTRGSDFTNQDTCPCVFEVPMMGFPSGGKIFLPCVPQGDLTGNAYSAGWIAAVNTFMATMVAGNAGSSYTWQPVVYSYKNGNYSTIASYHLSPFIGFMKKRKLISGRGRHKKKVH